MKDRELEEKLKRLREIVQRDVMKNWKFSAEMRANVHKMTNPGREIINPSCEMINPGRGVSNSETNRSSRFTGTDAVSESKISRSKLVKLAFTNFWAGLQKFRRVHLAAAAAVFAVFFAFIIFAWQLSENTGICTVKEQQMDMSITLTPELVKIVEMNNNGIESINYITLIRIDALTDNGENNGRNFDNGGNLIYNGLFDENNLLVPVETVPVETVPVETVLSTKTFSLPDQSGSLVLISAREKQKEIVGYKLLEYDEQKVITYLNQIFIPQGCIKTGCGYVIKRNAGGYSLFRWNGDNWSGDKFLEETVNSANQVH